MATDGRVVLEGQSISPGLALGEARIILRGTLDVAELPIPAYRVPEESELLEQAIQDTISELNELRKHAGERMAGPVAKIFDAQLLVAGDYEFLRTVKEAIARKKRNAGFVYSSLVAQTIAPLKNANDEYIRQMAVDIEAVARRVLNHLEGFGKKSDVNFDPNTIVIGNLFTPGEILMFHGRRATGFVVSEGGYNSHMGLIARSLGVPVILVPTIWERVRNGVRLLLDGEAGQVVIHPTEKDIRSFVQKRRKQGPTLATRIRSIAHIPPLTKDGRPVNVAANLTIPSPADQALALRGISIGLYRTEFLYLEEGVFPDEEAQFRHYQSIFERFSPLPVTIRVFDLGYDKLSASSPDWPAEDNPALGWRGIRVLLDSPAIFRTQVRAILRGAAPRGKVKLMLPMVSEIGEIQAAKKIISQERLKLKREGIPLAESLEIGVMIEVPAAAICADRIAPRVDFLSLGTNDLTQYTLAADRGNRRVSGQYSAFHPAVLSLIKLTVDAGKRYNKPVSVCGELAGDLLALPVLIGLGVDQLSMGPARLHDICRAIKRIDSSSARLLATTVLSAGTKEEVVENLQRFAAALDAR